MGIKGWWNEGDTDNPKLSQLKLFKASYVIPLSLAFVTAIAIILGEKIWDKEFCYKADCFYYLYDAFRIPLWIAAIALPLTGLVASHHRSVQMAKQIALTTDHNSFTNYWKHKETFEKSFSEYNLLGPNEQEIEVKFRSVQELYRTVFDFNFPYDFSARYRGDSETGIEVALGNIQKIIPVEGFSLDSEIIHGDSVDFINLLNILHIKEIYVDGKVFYVRKNIIENNEDCSFKSPIVFWVSVKLVFDLCKFASSPIPKETNGSLMIDKYDSSKRLYTVDFKDNYFIDSYEKYKSK